MGRASREKGKRYEQKLARLYRAARFTISRNSNQAHPNATDEDPKGDLLGLHAGGLRFHVQAKHQEAIAIWACLDQTESEAPVGFIPALHFRRNNSRDWVAVPLEAWLQMLRMLEDATP